MAAVSGPASLVPPDTQAPKSPGAGLQVSQFRSPGATRFGPLRSKVDPPPLSPLRLSFSQPLAPMAE